MIEAITFTGVDGETSLSRLSALAERYPKAEFGILVGSSVGGIFPSMEVVEHLKAHAGDEGYRVALHLCGKYSRMVVDPKGSADERALRDLCTGFGRVQVNLPGRWFKGRRGDASRERVKRFADSVTAENVILQHRGDWGSIPVRHRKVEYLFDVSGGRGIDSFARWPEPSGDLRRTGYAGGMGPHNIGRAVAFASAHMDTALWFDMEGRIRKNGLLDLAAVESVCSQVFDRQGS